MGMTSSSATPKQPLHHHQRFPQLLALWPSASAIPMRTATTTHFSPEMLCASAELVWKATVSSELTSVETRNAVALISTSARKEPTTARASRASSATIFSDHSSASSTSDAKDQQSAIHWQPACQSARTTAPARAQRDTAATAWASEDVSTSTSAMMEATCATQLLSAST